MSERLAKVVTAPVPSRPTRFQLQWLLLGKEPTNQSRLKRIVDELRGLRTESEAIEDEIGEVTDRVSLLNLDIMQEQDKLTNDPFVQERFAIRLRQVERQRRAHQRRLDELVAVLEGKREQMNFLLDVYEKIIAVEPQKNWDSDEVQLQYWEAKLGQELNTRQQLGAPIDIEVVRTVLALPPNSQLRKSITTPRPKELSSGS